VGDKVGKQFLMTMGTSSLPVFQNNVCLYAGSENVPVLITCLNRKIKDSEGTRKFVNA
jgi:hypothetical protein